MKKKNLAVVIITAISCFVSCSTSILPRRGIMEGNSNVYFSTHYPSVKITINDKLEFVDKQHKSYLFSDHNGHSLSIYYQKNPMSALQNKIDYYLPLDTVMYESVSGNNRMAYSYGTETIHNKKFSYCSFIEFEDTHIFLVKSIALSSSNHDILEILFAEYVAYSGFRGDFSSAKDFFRSFPLTLERFENYFSDAIVQIEDYQSEQ